MKSNGTGKLGQKKWEEWKAMRIGVLSDSHFRAGRPMPQVAAIFRDVAMILHAGDVGDSELLDWLRGIAPVDWVAGNCDRGFETAAWPSRRVLQAEGVTIGMIHGDGYGGTTPERVRRAFLNQPVQAVVFGHSHQPWNQTGQDGVLLFNPGSVSFPRGMAHQASCGILTIENDQITGNIFYL